MSVQGAIFFVLSALYLFATVLWVNEEFWSPKWIKFQKEYYEEQASKAEKEYEASTTVKGKRDAWSTISILEETCI